MPKPARRKRIQLLFLILLTIFALYLSYWIARPFLTSIVLAAVLAIAMQPLLVRLRRRLSKGSAALVVTLLLVFAVLLPASWMGNRIAHEAAGLYSSLEEQQAEQGSWREYLSGLLDVPLNWIAARTGVPQPQLKKEVMGRMRDAGAAALNWGKSLAVNIGSMIFNLVIVLVTLFFLLRDGGGFRAKIGFLLPIGADRYQRLTRVVEESIAANVYGVFAVAAAQGALGLIGYLIAGLPSVMLWALMTGLFSVIPVVGTASVWGSGCVYLIVIGSWGKAVFLLLYGLCVISLADNIVRPWVFSGRVRLHSLLVLFSLLGGVEAFGVVGLFIGPIVVSVTMALLQMLGEERAAWERAAEGTDISSLHKDEAIF